MNHWHGLLFAHQNVSFSSLNFRFIQFKKVNKNVPFLLILTKDRKATSFLPFLIKMVSISGLVHGRLWSNEEALAADQNESRTCRKNQNLWDKTLEKWMNICKKERKTGWELQKFSKFPKRLYRSWKTRSLTNQSCHPKVTPMCRGSLLWISVFSLAYEWRQISKSWQTARLVGW